MNETITVSEGVTTIRKPYYIIEDGPEMKVTAEDLVRAIQRDDWLHWATMTGWVDKEEYGDYQALLFALQHLANLITLPEPTPTIPGTINGTPATFEVVYRAED